MDVLFKWEERQCMKLEDIVKQAKEKALALLNSAEDKPAALLEAMELVVSASHDELIQKITADASRAASDEQFAKSLNLRILNDEETKFYSLLKSGLKQAITVDQVDYIPTTIIDRTLDDVKKGSKLLQLINFAPAGVKRWFSASKTGKGVWGGITDAITAELSATITGLNMEVSKFHVLLLIPKAIRDLGLPFVDKYFMAILKEAFEDGIEEGYLVEDGKDAPIGIYRLINTSVDGVHTAKTVSTAITNFKPKTLAPVKKALNNGGKRSIEKIYLICNPADEADFVDPALYNDEGKMISSYKNLEVISTPNNPLGKAVFTLAGMYTMGLNDFKLNEYKEAKALDDVDAIIVKAYGNGRAVDDNCAFVFDVTKLEEYVPTVKSIAVTEGA